MSATISHLPGHHTTLHHYHSCIPKIIVTIDALGESDDIQNVQSMKTPVI